MDREQLKQYLRDYVEQITRKSAGANMYVCPLCGSGNGKNGTGAFSVKGTHWKCFSCGEGGDIFDLIAAHEGIADHTAQLKRAGELFGITVDSYRSTAREGFSPAPEYQKQAENERATQSNIHNRAYTIQQQEKAEPDYTDFFLQANKDIERTNYHRGLTLETLNRFKLGYVESWTHPKAPQAPPSPRLIIPTSKHSYLARDTRAELTDEQRKYSKSKVGKVRIFNSRALREAQKPVFIVEGELDALSIIDVGGEAVALGSTANKRALLTMLESQKPSQPLIIAMDNDEAGSKANRELTEGLERLNIPFYRIDIAQPHKDANEALNADREAFRATIEQAENIEAETLEAEREAYLKNSTANYLQNFIDGISDSVDTPYIPTGFKKLDSVLDGGLYEGLCVIGAISSIGKTTFCLQIADQIAQSGQDVLIFSLEMARSELVSKSISRHTLQSVLETGGDIQNAKTARAITTGKRYIDYSQTEIDLINSSILAYGKYAQHIYISEGVGDIGTRQIRETIKKHILFTGKTPVVVIDYIQILAPADVRATDKQNMDKAVLELKRISRDYKTPVIAISSLNRANYNTAISMEALKETGGLEYGSDIVIGLQLKGTGGKAFDVNEAKKRNPREIELVILKNRNGRTGDRVKFRYYTIFNYFEELPRPDRR